MQRCRRCDVAIPLRDSSRNYFAQCLFEKLSLELHTGAYSLRLNFTFSSKKEKTKKKTYIQRVIARKNGLSTKESYEQKITSFTAAATVKY